MTRMWDEFFSAVLTKQPLFGGDWALNGKQEAEVQRDGQEDRILFWGMGSFWEAGHISDHLK